MNRRPGVGQRHPVCGHGQGLGEQVWQVRDGCRRRIVLVRARRNHDGPAIQGQLGHLSEYVGIHVVVHTDHPGGIAEKLCIPGTPAGFRGTGHGVAADESLCQTVFGHHLQDSRFHTGDVGKRTFRSELRDAVQQRGQGRHRHREHDQGLGVTGSPQRQIQIGGGVVAGCARGVGALGRTVVSPGVPPGGGGRAYERAADESEAKYADRGRWWSCSAAFTPSGWHT